MGRGRYPARLHVAPPPPEIAAHYLHVWPGHELYAHPEAFPALSSPALFGNQRPLALDLGCATGELVLALAALHPEINYVGVDVVGKPLWRAVERAVEAKCENLRFVQADARLVYRQVPDAALHAVYLHFPAPLLRRSQRKQLLISGALLTQMQRCLKPGGLLSILTDQPQLFDQLQRLLADTPALQLVPPEQWSVAMTELVKSHYHRRWEQRGRPILRAELMRRPSDEAMIREAMRR